MKIVFFGTPEYVLPILEVLYKHWEVAAVVTQKPKPVGRKQFLSFSPVDTYAHKRKIPVVFDFDKIPAADLGVCAAFGKIIPKNTIDSFKYGILNVHPSLLPKYRGASPIQTAIANGDSVTGVTVIKMDEKMDHGPIVAQFKEDILPTDTFETLRNRLFEKSAAVLTELLEPYIKGKIAPRTQNDSQVSLTKVLTKEDGLIVLQGSDPLQVDRLIRAMTPWPGVWTQIKLQMPNDKSQIKRLKLLKAHLEDGELILDEVQLEGKRPVSWERFVSGYPNFTFS